MTRSLSLRNVYVEGDDDVAVLSRWFPRLQFKASGGKDQVGRKVEQDSASYGLLDRDFAPDGEVEASREPHSRMVIMQRLPTSFCGGWTFPLQAARLAD